jgi:hypothetical protein
MRVGLKRERNEAKLSRIGAVNQEIQVCQELQCNLKLVAPHRLMLLFCVIVRLVLFRSNCMSLQSNCVAIEAQFIFHL